MSISTDCRNWQDGAIVAEFLVECVNTSSKIEILPLQRVECMGIFRKRFFLSEHC